MEVAAAILLAVFLVVGFLYAVMLGDRRTAATIERIRREDREHARNRNDSGAPS